MSLIKPDGWYDPQVTGDIKMVYSPREGYPPKNWKPVCLVPPELLDWAEKFRLIAKTTRSCAMEDLLSELEAIMPKEKNG